MKIQPYLAKAARVSVEVSRRVARTVRIYAPMALRAARDFTQSAFRAVWFNRTLRAALVPVASIARIAMIACAVGYASTAALRATTQTVRPTEIGVIQKEWGSDAGIVPKDIGPSKRFVIPGRATLHRLDRRIHFVRFGMESEGNQYPSLELRTPDDLEVRVGATTAYRIIEGEAHALVSDGIRSTYADLARAAVERVLLDSLGSLTRTQWYSLEARAAVEQSALAEIRAAMAPFHLEPLSLKLSSTWFPPEFELEMMEQKLLEQRILTDAMLARRDKRLYELTAEQERVKGEEAARAAELNLAIKVERTELSAAVRALESEAVQYAFDRSTEADNLYEKALTSGRLEVDRAEALRERLLNEALESEGGRIMIARDAASNLRFKTVKLDANNPNVPSVLDLDALIKMLIGQE